MPHGQYPRRAAFVTRPWHCSTSWFGCHFCARGIGEALRFFSYFSLCLLGIEGGHFKPALHPGLISSVGVISYTWVRGAMLVGTVSSCLRGPVGMLLCHILCPKAVGPSLPVAHVQAYLSRAGLLSFWPPPSVLHSGPLSG